MVDIQYIEVDELNLSFVEEWYKKTVQKEGFQLGEVAVLLGNDDWLLNYNKEYLQHDYYTDIITFNYCFDDVISGDLLISLERVEDNAKQFNVSRETELKRVLIHGVLHLCGYNDATEDEKKLIREKEDYYLQYLK